MEAHQLHYFMDDRKLRITELTVVMISRSAIGTAHNDAIACWQYVASGHFAGASQFKAVLQPDTSSSNGGELTWVSVVEAIFQHLLQATLHAKLQETHPSSSGQQCSLSARWAPGKK